MQLQGKRLWRLLPQVLSLLLLAYLVLHMNQPANQAANPTRAWALEKSLFSHLVLVPCHAVYTGSDYAAWHNPKNWLLLPYQSGQQRDFVKHIRSANLAAGRDAAALVIYSGGQTRLEAGPRSEAASYLNVGGYLYSTSPRPALF